MEELDSSRSGSRWSLQGMTALVTGGTKGIGYPFPPSPNLSFLPTSLNYTNHASIVIVLEGFAYNCLA